MATAWHNRCFWRAILLIGLVVGTCEVRAEDEVLELRREFNQVAASIDTLVRLYGGKQLEKLADQQRDGHLLPDGYELVLIFWADDEAEIFLNDYRVSDTRLTPTQVVIPPFYLKESNLIRAHCWDTDRIESGFMAGLYLRDRRGGLRKVLTTQEGKWWFEGKPAEERYYTHTQPDIPGARVIWGDKLFGEIWLEARFPGSLLQRATRLRPASSSTAQVEERSMEAHAVVSRLVQLQERRQELEQALKASRYATVPVRYKGYMKGQLAFTLGHAGPLAEEQSTVTAEKLKKWAESLPVEDKGLVYRERRELKGVEKATGAEDFEAGEATEEEDRKADYQPPPEREGPIEEGTGVVVAEVEVRRPLVSRRNLQWSLVITAAGLCLYLGVTGRQWWRLFRGKVWVS